MSEQLKWRGMLIHLTHYDPRWWEQKSRERRFNRATTRAVIRATADTGMNLLIIDVADAVLYRSLPHLRKRYSVPMTELTELVEFAREAGLEVVPKLNFARSPRHRHSHWLDPEQSQPDSPTFWKQGLAAVDEVLDATGATMLHVGMDEDDTRSPDEYRKATLRLHRELTRRKIRMLMWAEVGHETWRPQQRWKEIPTLRELPRDVILMPWSYTNVIDDWARRLKRWGFDVVPGCQYGHPSLPGKHAVKNVRAWADAAQNLDLPGLVLTKWIRLSRPNRAILLEAIRESGPVMATT
jgi:hypothetical protein